MFGCSETGASQQRPAARPTGGGRGTYVSGLVQNCPTPSVFPVPNRPDLVTLVDELLAAPVRCGPPTAVSAESLLNEVRAGADGRQPIDRCRGVAR